jgi:hypothetical protein
MMDQSANECFACGLPLSRSIHSFIPSMHAFELSIIPVMVACSFGISANQLALSDLSEVTRDA